MTHVRKYGTHTRWQQRRWQQWTDDLTVQTGTTSTPRGQFREDYGNTRGSSAPIRRSSDRAEDRTKHSAQRRTSIHDNSKDIQQEHSARCLQASHGGTDHRDSGNCCPSPQNSVHKSRTQPSSATSLGCNATARRSSMTCTVGCSRRVGTRVRIRNSVR